MFDSVATSDNVSYILSDELKILHTNAAWERFARENGDEVFLQHWHRASLLDAIPGALQTFFRERFARAQLTQERWEHDYECSSPTVFRQYRMIVYPVGSVFIVTHALLVEMPHDRTAHDPSPRYERSGVISMCSHCRRVRRAGEPEAWDWVPAYVTPIADNVSHGLCPPCYRYYYE